MSKVPIKIELSAKEDAIIYYEKTMGSNITIQKRATVLYYASKGAESITELHKSCGYTRVFIRATLNGYWEKGIEYIYECSRGIKQVRWIQLKTNCWKNLKRTRLLQYPKLFLE